MWSRSQIEGSNWFLVENGNSFFFLASILQTNSLITFKPDGKRRSQTEPLKRVLTTGVCLSGLAGYHPWIISKHGSRRRDGLHVWVSEKTDNDLGLTQLIDRTNRDSGDYTWTQTEMQTEMFFFYFFYLTSVTISSFLLSLVLLFFGLSSCNQGHQVHLDSLPQLPLSNQVGPERAPLPIISFLDCSSHCNRDPVWDFFLIKSLTCQPLPAFPRLNCGTSLNCPSLLGTASFPLLASPLLCSAHSSCMFEFGC